MQDPSSFRSDFRGLNPLLYIYPDRERRAAFTSPCRQILQGHVLTRQQVGKLKRIYGPV
ncbi:hypothetical protein SCLCIDRAFT_1214137 [Scleroderma citrinum Foug A]|uniref:Uncharacterized protein n=1 Tax=Scleroderma citrinum Foug A TaxID=1036808 RepID=A0A0C3DS85_9AGAM|nr:hypothetical protein SCLCIDRAFT_1214137 [Scleroderma citrinum Foug A]